MPLLAVEARDSNLPPAAQPQTLRGHSAVQAAPAFARQGTLEGLMTCAPGGGHGSPPPCGGDVGMGATARGVGHGAASAGPARPCMHACTQAGNKGLICSKVNRALHPYLPSQS